MSSGGIYLVGAALTMVGCLFWDGLMGRRYDEPGPTGRPDALVCALFWPIILGFAVLAAPFIAAHLAGERVRRWARSA